MTTKLSDLCLIALGFLFVALAVIAASTLTAIQTTGRYNVHIDVTGDGGTNASQYPKCDNGENFFVAFSAEWQKGNRMEQGQTCYIAGISAKEVAKKVEELLLKRGIDPMTASEDTINGVTAEVLQGWAGKIIAH